MMRAALLAMACFAASPAFVSAQLFPDCKCPDLREMRDRFCSARAARNEYERIQRLLNSERGRTGEARLYSLADKNMINQVCVQEAINTASDQGVGKATAVTNENLPPESLFMEDCRVKVTSKNHTACQKQIVEAHEAYHSQECTGRSKLWADMEAQAKLTLQSLLGKVTGDTKYLLTSAEFAAEEATSYGLEMHLIFAKWEQLKKTCQASDFETEVENEGTLGKNFWDNLTPDSNGKRIYKMKDLSNDPCPRRPLPNPRACTLQ